MGRHRTIPGNGQTTIAVIFGPDRHALQAASLGMVTNTFSPMSAGRHSAGASPRGFVGDRGYGVNRMGGRTGPLQLFAGAAAAVKPIRAPKSSRLGANAGVSGQPGLPSTGTSALFGAGYAPAGWGG